MTPENKGHLEVEDRGAVLIVRVDGGPLGVDRVPGPHLSGA